MKIFRLPLLPLALTILASCHTASPLTEFNPPGQRRTRTCVVTAANRIPLLFPDGSPTGFYASADDPSKQGDNQPDCPPGSIEIDAHETLTTSDGTILYFHPGGGPSHYNNYVENGQYGHVRASNLKSPPPTSNPAGTGKPAPVLSSTQYFLSPTRIPRDMFYKPNNLPSEDKTSGSTYYTYGNPGYDKTNGQGDYTYITWSWVQNGNGFLFPQNKTAGGGMVRALGKRDAFFNPCTVDAIVGCSYGPDNIVNGRVTAIYGRTTAGKNGSDIFGWTPHSYQKQNDIIVPCIRRLRFVPLPYTGEDQRSDDPYKRMALNLIGEHLPAEENKLPLWRTNLMDNIRHTRSSGARIELLTKLAVLDDARTVQDLVEILRYTNDPLVRDQCIVLLGYLASTPPRMAEVLPILGKVYDRAPADSRTRLLLLELRSRALTSPPPPRPGATPN